MAAVKHDPQNSPETAESQSPQPPMNLYQKLLELQRRVDAMVKDGKNTSDKYDFASDENVLDRFRPLMDELGLLLIPEMAETNVREGTTRSGTVRYLTEVHWTMTWHDVDSGAERPVPWYSQGVDLAGEKGVGKAATYAEKYFLLKFFHVPTKKDDPDSDGRTQAGEKKQRGTQAARENEAYYRAAISQMMTDLYGEDQEKIKAAYVAMTKSDKRGFAGHDKLEDVSPAALPVLYGKLKPQYEERVGHTFELKPAAEAPHAE